MSMDLLCSLNDILAVIIAVISTLLISKLLAVCRRRKVLEAHMPTETLRDFERLRSLSDDSMEHEKQKITESKKRNFLGGPWRFYYIDKDGIDSLHSQIIPTMRVTEKEIEKVGGTSKGVSAELPLVKPSYEKKESEKEREKMERTPETSEMKYNYVLKLLIDKELAVFGVEEFVYNQRREKLFELEISKIEKEFGYDIHDQKEFISGFIRQNRKAQVDRKMNELRDSIGKYVLIQGDFEVNRSNGGGYTLSCTHPVSEVLEKKLVLSVFCSDSCTTRFGTDAFTRMVKINVRIFGTITYFDESKATVNINPISLH